MKPHALTQPHLFADDPGPAPVLEPDSCDAPLGQKKVQRSIGQRILVRVTSHRARLIDEDNLCEKYAIDLCRYAGIIIDDSPGEVKIEVRQFKTLKGEDERTQIEVFEIGGDLKI